MSVIGRLSARFERELTHRYILSHWNECEKKQQADHFFPIQFIVPWHGSQVEKGLRRSKKKEEMKRKKMEQKNRRFQATSLSFCPRVESQS